MVGWNGSDAGLTYFDWLSPAVALLFIGTANETVQGHPIE